MNHFLRLLAVCCWLAGPLVAQPSPTPEKHQKGLALTLEAQNAYRQNDPERAYALAESAAPLLEFGEEKHVWCMVLQMHLGIQAMATEMAAKPPYLRKVSKAEAAFLTNPTPKNAVTLIDRYEEAGRRADNVIFAMGWRSVVFCLTRRYDPARQAMAQRQLFGGIESLANKILPEKEQNLSDEEKTVKNQERQAVYTLFKQLATTKIPPTVSNRELGRDPVGWEAAYAKVVKQHGANSLQAATTLKSISNFYQAIGDTKTATARLRKAISILQPQTDQYAPDLLACHMDMALLSLQTNQYDSATNALQKAYPLLISLNRLNMSMAISGRRKEVYAMANNDLRSLFAFAACVGRHRNDPALQALAYDAMLYVNGLLLDDARSLRDHLRRQLANNPTPALQQAYADWLTQRQAFVSANATQRETIGEQLAATEARLAKFANPTNHADLTWQQIQARLRPGEAAVSFIQYTVVSQKEYNRFPLPLPSFDSTALKVEMLHAAMVIRPGYDHPRFVPLGTDHLIGGLLTHSQNPSDLYKASRGPGFQNITYGDSLYQVVWQPIAGWLKGATRVYISAEGSLSRVAFAALPLPATSDQTPRRKRYLSGQHELCQLFSIRQLEQGIRPLSVAANTSVGLMGGIDYRVDTNPKQADQQALDRGGTIAGPSYLQQAIAAQGLVQLEPLQATEPEVRAIATLFTNHRLILDRKATERRFRQFSGQAPTLMHIATHGLYLPHDYSRDDIDNGIIISDDAMTRSGLAMAAINQLWDSSRPVAAPDDGLLTAYEVADLDLSQTRLAVLSACQTGLGASSLFGNEGVLGLQRGLLLAGVEKMVLSLWDVDDARTQQFMTAFYTYLKNGREVRDAFGQAQADLQRGVDDPAIWAAFVLIE